MPRYEQLLYSDVYHLCPWHGTHSSAQSDMGSSQWTDVGYPGADAQAHGKHKELWRVSGDAPSSQSSVHPVLRYGSSRSDPLVHSFLTILSFFSVGVYLTDLTFIEDGIPSNTPSDLINFNKRAKTAEVIRDIQQYQSVPYQLQPVPELQDYILSSLHAAGDVHDMYDRSLEVEPREREDEKIARYDRSNRENPPSLAVASLVASLR